MFKEWDRTVEEPISGSISLDAGKYSEREFKLMTSALSLLIWTGLWRQIP